MLKQKPPPKFNLQRGFSKFWGDHQKKLEAINSKILDGNTLFEFHPFVIILETEEQASLVETLLFRKGYRYRKNIFREFCMDKNSAIKESFDIMKYCTKRQKFYSCFTTTLRGEMNLYLDVPKEYSWDLKAKVTPLQINVSKALRVFQESHKL